LVDYIPLCEGDKVYVRPYVGLYYEVEDGMYRVFGKEQFRGDDKISKVPYWEHVLAKVDGDDIVPVGQNVIVEPHLLASTIAVEGIYQQKATVIAAGDETEWEKGDVVLLKKDCEQLKWAMGGNASHVMVYDADIVRCIVEDS
jgi:co-chaperonin GroES (HSP10)